MTNTVYHATLSVCVHPLWRVIKAKLLVLDSGPADEREGRQKREKSRDPSTLRGKTVGKASVQRKKTPAHQRAESLVEPVSAIRAEHFSQHRLASRTN